jgi:hypothetical protein
MKKEEEEEEEEEELREKEDVAIDTLDGYFIQNNANYK